MKLLFQFINHKNGQRSGVLELTREQLAQELVRTRHLYRDNPEVVDNTNNDYVLVLMEKPDGENEEYSFSIAPLFTASDFINMIYTTEQLEQQLDQLDKLSDEKLQEQYA